MTVQPAQINALALPSVPLKNHSTLPAVPASYFVLDGDDTVLYIGMTTRLVDRWNVHHRYRQFRAMKALRIAWLVVSDVQLLKSIVNTLRM